MALEGYKEVRKGVYQSDEFFTKRPKIDSERIRQILDKQRSYTPPSNTNNDICTWNPDTAKQPSNEGSGV